MLVGNIKLKLARKRKQQPQTFLKFRPPSSQQIQNYNDFINSSLEAGGLQDSSDPFADWAVLLTEAASASFTPLPPTQKKPYISEAAWQILCQKQVKLAAGLGEDARNLEKQLRKQVRKDKRLYMQQQLEEITDQGYQWTGIKKPKRKFTPRHTKFTNQNGRPIPEAQFAEAAAQ